MWLFRDSDDQVYLAVEKKPRYEAFAVLSHLGTVDAGDYAVQRRVEGKHGQRLLHLHGRLMGTLDDALEVKPEERGGCVSARCCVGIWPKFLIGDSVTGSSTLSKSMAQKSNQITLKN